MQAAATRVGARAPLTASRPGRAPRTRVSPVLAAKGQAYVCIDCGWIYDGREDFQKLPSSYRCPVCNAPKRRFKATASQGKNDAKSMRARMDRMARGEDDGKLDEGDRSFFAAAAVGGALALGVLYVFLQQQTAGL